MTGRTGLSTTFSLFPKSEWRNVDSKRLIDYLESNDFTLKNKDKTVWSKLIRHDDGTYTMNIILTDNGSCRDIDPEIREDAPVKWFGEVRNPPTREELREDRAYHKLLAKKNLKEAFHICEPSFDYVVL